MIYISEDTMDLDRFFQQGGFTKRGDNFYYTAIEEAIDTYVCVKLSHEFSDKRFELEIVRIFTNDQYEEIETEEIINDEDLKADVLYEFFTTLSYEDHPQKVMIFEPLIDLIKEYLLESDFSAEENILYGDCMNLFRLEGKVVEGYYEGNLVLTDVQLKNNSTGEVIKSFDNVNVCSNFYVSEEDEDQVDYLIECYLETLSEYDIKNIFLESELFTEGEA